MAKSAGLESALRLRNSLMGLRLAKRVPSDCVRTESKRAPRLCIVSVCYDVLWGGMSVERT
jgi:hypothetical protein